MKIREIWQSRLARLQEQSAPIMAEREAFASGVRAAAVEILTRAKDLLNDEDAGRLSARLMAAADHVEGTVGSPR